MAHHHDREVVQRYIKEHMDSDSVSNGCELRLQHSSGHWIWILLRGSIVEFDETNGHIPLRIAGTITDITATKRIERETENLLHRLEHLIKERLSPHDRFPGNPAADSMLSKLSRRQIEVLRLIASGSTTAEIAKLLHISEATVQSHRKEIMQKLGQKNIATLTRFAIEAGVLGGDLEPYSD